MNNTSGTPQSILTTLRIAGIPHVPVTANISSKEVYFIKHYSPPLSDGGK